MQNEFATLSSKIIQRVEALNWTVPLALCRATSSTFCALFQLIAFLLYKNFPTKCRVKFNYMSLLSGNLRIHFHCYILNFSEALLKCNSSHSDTVSRNSVQDHTDVKILGTKGGYTSANSSPFLPCSARWKLSKRMACSWNKISSVQIENFCVRVLMQFY